MSATRAIAAEVQDAWTKLSSGWKGEVADVFYNQYITKISESAASFECACAELIDLSTEVSRELETLAQSFANQS